MQQGDEATSGGHCLWGFHLLVSRVPLSHETDSGQHQELPGGHAPSSEAHGQSEMVRLHLGRLAGCCQGQQGAGLVLPLKEPRRYHRERAPWQDRRQGGAGLQSTWTWSAPERSTQGPARYEQEDLPETGCASKEGLTSTPACVGGAQGHHASPWLSAN